jgi:hypothetical protein
MQFGWDFGVSEERRYFVYLMANASKENLHGETQDPSLRSG